MGGVTQTSRQPHGQERNPPGKRLGKHRGAEQGAHRNKNERVGKLPMILKEQKRIGIRADEDVKIGSHTREGPHQGEANNFLTLHYCLGYNSTDGSLAQRIQNQYSLGKFAGTAGQPNWRARRYNVGAAEDSPEQSYYHPGFQSLRYAPAGGRCDTNKQVTRARPTEIL